MAKGNPNPSPETRFTSSGNHGGKTAKQKQAEVRSAELAALIREKALEAMMSQIEDGTMKPLDAVTSDFLRLFKDSEDRAHGTPKATVAGAGENGEHVLTYVIRDMTKDA